MARPQTSQASDDSIRPQNHTEFAVAHVRLNPDDLEPRPLDREIFEKHLRSFVPESAFDFHAHLYRGADMPVDGDLVAPKSVVGIECYRRQMNGWMGGRAPRNGLFFAVPRPQLEMAGANQFCVVEAGRDPSSRALLVIQPGDDPAAVEAMIDASQQVVVGFKPYHVFAERGDTFHAEMDEFLPQWAWELAHQRRLLLMMHLVLPLALSDRRNHEAICRRCRQYPDARLILAHAGRGFNAGHTVDGVAAIAGLDNVLFDTSVICEPGAFLAILEKFGPRRLLFGSDYPVSNLIGRCSSVGDGFFWLYDNNVDWSSGANCERTLVGVESLLALRQASQLAHLTDADVESIFRTNAERELGLEDPAPLSGAATYSRARQVIPGGTQLLSKRPEMYAPDVWPAYFREARGVEVVDVDGREFVDMSSMSVGACLLGYADADVNAAVTRRVMLGAMCSLNTPDEVDLAELLLRIHPWADAVRYARAGGEALAIAVRIARAATRRSKIAFCGYHGWQDWYLAANLVDDASRDPLAGHLLSGLEPAGVPRELAGTALPFQYNRLDELAAIVKEHGNDLAAVVIEPTRRDRPEPGFLEGVRALADRCRAVLVFDEVSAGWRLCLGGAHLLFGVQPDMAVYSKAIANGFPLAAVLGVDSVMQAAQESFISSTMWTDGVGPAAALATIRKLQQHDVPTHVASIGETFREKMLEAARRRVVAIEFSGPPALTAMAFDHPESAALQTRFTVGMLQRGYLMGAGFYPSFAHRAGHIDACVEAADEVFAELHAAIESGDPAAGLPGPVKHSGFQRLA